MKLPPFAAASLELDPGVPSPALLRAAEAWPVSQRDSQLAAVLQTAGCRPLRFVLVATTDPVEKRLPSGAVLAESLPGRAAVVMTPQVDETFAAVIRNQLASELLLALDDMLRAEGVLLAQALTDYREQAATQQFQASGYQIVGDMLYLGAELVASPPQRITGLPSLPLELVPHSPADFERWVPLIDRTYEQTLDCPAVDGLRPTRDVLLGYRDIGVQRDDWWFVAQHAGQDVGCLLLADHRPATQAELVYMGLLPEMRGRGWGVFLAQQALQIAAASGAEHLVLSVDAANLPARRHYQAAGFHVWEQRTILVKSLR